MPRPLVLLLAVATLLASAALHAELPTDRLAAILARAIAYDRALKERTNDAVDVAVVWKSDDAAAGARAHSIAAAFKALGDLKVAGLPIRVHETPFVAADANAAVFTANHVDAAFVVGSLGADLPRLLVVCAAQRVLSMGDSRAIVVAGAALGVEAVGDKPTIFVNLDAAKSEGANLAADLLRVATVIKTGGP